MKVLRNQLFLPLNFEVLIDENDPVRKLTEGCPHRDKCYKGKYENRKVSFSKTMARQKAEATDRITNDEGNILRQNRSIQVEGAFGVLKQDRDFRRFLTRGKTKTETQFLLLAFVFNIKKLWNRTIDGRLGLSLFNQQAA